MMKKIQDAGFRIVEVPVHHYHRAFGRSQFFNFRRMLRTGRDVLLLWFALVVRREHRRAGLTPLAQTGDRLGQSHLPQRAASVSGTTATSTAAAA